MSKSLKKIVGTAAPLLGTALFPGLGTALGTALGAGSAYAGTLGSSLLGAGGGLLGGGGLKSALAGALTGGAAAGGGTLLGGALGASGPYATALGSGILGAGTGAASGGGLRGALLSGAAGGLGGYYNAGGFNGLGEELGLIGENGLFGTAAGTPLTNGVGPTQGSGAYGALTRATAPLTSGGSSYTSAGSGSSYSAPRLSDILGGVSSTLANDDAEDDLLDAQRQALSRYQPYVDARFEPGDLTQDPGYQFRLQQGEQALGRQQSARGNYFSGGALKEAQQFGQGLADSTYNEAYNRWLAQNQQNIGVAGAMGDLDMQGGNVRAAAGVNNSNVLNRTLSSILGGYGAYTNTGAPQGQGQGWRYDPYTGQPVYA